MQEEANAYSLKLQSTTENQMLDTLRTESSYDMNYG